MEKLNYHNTLYIGYLDQFEFKRKGIFALGLFIDQPLFTSNFSLHANLFYTKHVYTKHVYSFKRFDTRDLDFVANTSSLKLPVLVRYSLPINTIRPFVNAGSMILYNFSKKMQVYETIINDNVYEIKQILNESMIEKIQLGYSVGGGIEVPITYRNSLFIEVGYSQLLGIKKLKSISNSEFSFSTSINF